jgi:RHS repeat-associated protein
MKYRLTFALVASLTSTAFAAFQAPLPEFKNEKQLAEWRAEKASEPTSQGYVVEETVFYTGKPYLASTGGYAFKYRSYSPELARWTSEDPSGFPDGANNKIYVNNQVLSLFDSTGLSGNYVDYYKYERELTKYLSLGELSAYIGGGALASGGAGAATGGVVGMGIGSIPSAVVGAVGAGIVGGVTAGLAKANMAYVDFINNSIEKYPIGDSVNPGGIVHTELRYSEYDLTFERYESSITGVGNWKSEWSTLGVKFTGTVTSFKTAIYE